MDVTLNQTTNSSKVSKVQDLFKVTQSQLRPVLFRQYNEMHLIVSRRTMLPSAVDWSEFHVWSFLVSDVEKTQHKNALRLGVELNCSSCMANRLPPKDRKLRVRFKF